MSQKIWKLLVAVFVIVASQAVLVVGILLGDGAAVTMIAMVSGLIGIAAGIILGVSAILAKGVASYGD